jgi:hypothetical protein
MKPRRTVVGVHGDAFTINGPPTYAGRAYRGMPIEGLLMNARMVQGIFDDLNPETHAMWTYPDGPWDPERNTEEFAAAMSTWHDAGLLGFTINLQGGNPRGYSRDQPWHNSAFDPEGFLRLPYMERLASILDRADELGMVPILGLFYFGQDQRLIDEAAVVQGTQNATDWLLEQGYTNVLVEIANEVDVGRYEHPILVADRCHELVELVQVRSTSQVDSPAGRLLVSASTRGGTLPPQALLDRCDYVLLHGNGVADPARLRDMVRRCRTLAGYRGQPILFNEDDHFGFGQPDNNMLAAVSEHAGWGYFDYRMEGEGFSEGYQSVPVDWGIHSARKRGFFGLLAQVTGACEEDSLPKEEA